MNLDPNTPVVVGVGQAAERIDDPDYRGMSPVELAAAAARAAVDDCGAEDAGAAIDTVAGVRQFEISGVINAPLGQFEQLPAIRGQPHRCGARARNPRDRRRPGASAPDHRAGGGNRGGPLPGRDGVRFGCDLDPALLRESRSQARLHRDGRRRLGRPGPGHREARLALHRRPRADERADPVRAAGECPAGRDRAGAGGVSAADG